MRSHRDAQVVTTLRPQVSGVLTQVRSGGAAREEGPAVATIDLGRSDRAAAGDRARCSTRRARERESHARAFPHSASQTDRALLSRYAASRSRSSKHPRLDRANEATARADLGYTRVVAPVAGRIGLRPSTSQPRLAGDATASLITQLRRSTSSSRFRRTGAADPGPFGSGGSCRYCFYVRGRRSSATACSAPSTTISTADRDIMANAPSPWLRTLFPNRSSTCGCCSIRSTRGGRAVTALRQGRAGPSLVLRDDRRCTVRHVERGIATAEVVSITKGLEAGERVVTEGADRLREGARVQLADAAASGASAAGRGRGGRGERGERSDRGERPARPSSAP